MKPNKKTVEKVQARLHELGYVNTGPVDGLIDPKGKTEAAILDVRNALDLPLKPIIDAQLIRALESAPKKEIPVEQATATAADIAPKVEAVRQNRWTKFWAKVAAWPMVTISGALAVLNQFDDAVLLLAPLVGLATEVPGWVWIGCTGFVATLLALSLNRTENVMVDGYQKGTSNNDTKAA